MTDLLDALVRPIPVAPDGDPAAVHALVEREWLVTNGIGGYASASVAGFATRKYHGLLVAALPNPAGRTVMLHHLEEQLVLADGTTVTLTGAEHVDAADAADADDAAPRLDVPGLAHLRAFRLEAGLPVWEYAVGDVVLERRVVMPHRQNTTYLTWRVVQGDAPVRLLLRPLVHFRHHEAELGPPPGAGYRLALGDASDAVHEIACDGAPAALRLRLVGGAATFTHDATERAGRHYRVEAARGYPSTARLWSPGTFALDLAPGATGALVASAEAADTLDAMTPDEALAAEHERRRRLLRGAPAAARTGVAAELVLAADQFVIVPTGRRRDAARAQAEGDEIRSVIAGYHWFTDWGRDTMIAFEGLTLSTGRAREAGSILRTFAHYVRDGLLPNFIPDGANEGLYHTADATLWFFHAVDRYLQVTGDAATVARLLPTMTDIAERHLAGTRYGIRVDPADGLLTQGAEGYQLTWMDAKCDGWVVTPRRGKAVELNALWYNALRVLEGWTRRFGDDARAEGWAAHAARARTAFNARFWHAAGGYLYDVVDGPDGDSAECRPNQLFAVALPHAVLDVAHWASVVRVVEERLVTPVGLRSLAPGSAGYAPRYEGVLRARDAAYHQGTVWGWLVGPWIDAWRRVHPDDPSGARRWLDGLVAHLDDFGVGSVAEVFDAEAPHTPRGCIAQAWSVAEVLRQLVRVAAEPGADALAATPGAQPAAAGAAASR